MKNEKMDHKNDPKNAVVSNASYCKVPNVQKNMSELAEGFLEYARYELNFSPQTIRKYGKNLEYFIRDIGDKPVEQYEVQEFVHLKKLMMERGNCETTIAGVVYAVRSFMLYCKNFLNLNVIQTKQIRPPRRFKREVVFLTKEEIEAFINTIKTKNWNEFRFRVLVEVLLGTGMRIGEVLSLNRKVIDWEKQEAKIIGKGSKPRTLFLTNDTLFWIDKYLSLRKDENSALFVSLNGKSRWQQTDVGRSFRRYKNLSGIKKHFTIHTLRHTFATQYLMKGAGINVVQTALGHSDAVTTLKYYAGAVNKAKVREMINDRHFDFIPQSALKNVAMQ